MSEEAKTITLDNLPSGIAHSVLRHVQQKAGYDLPPDTAVVCTVGELEKMAGRTADLDALQRLMKQKMPQPGGSHAQQQEAHREDQRQHARSD